jgi:hypothetical protein
MKRRKVLLPARMTSWRPHCGSRAQHVLVARRLTALALMGSVFLLAAPGIPCFGAFLDTPKDSRAVSEAAAQSLADKMARLSTPIPRSSPSWGPVGITEAEANSYLKYRGYEFLPWAVHDPEIHIAADHLWGAAEVDFDELGRIGAEAGDWGMRVLPWVFRGKQRVLATGKLQTGEGQGKLAITSLTVGTTAIPPGFVNFLLQSYMETRYGIDLSKPFRLPPHVTHIELGAGRAVFHRSPTRSR